MRRRPLVRKPWHAAPDPADNAVVLTLEEFAEIEAARTRHRQEMKKRARLARDRARRSPEMASKDSGAGFPGDGNQRRE
jgi:hypothetical protein